VAQFWRVLAFSPEAQSELLRLDDGDALAATTSPIEPSRRFLSCSTRGITMKQRLDSHPVPVTPDYNESLILAIELSNSKWVLAAQVPGFANVKNKRTIDPTVEALMLPSKAIALVPPRWAGKFSG
jgi:hypothetical protein